ncbi:Iron-uptake system-binding protein precursor [compost metagenome]
MIQDLKSKEAEAKVKLQALVGDETVPIKDYPQSESSVSISLEKIPEFNPDHIILQLDDESSEEVQKRYKEMLSSSLWKNMTAVQKHQVYLLGGKEWFSLVMSPLADSNAIDDVLRAFEKKGK